jgi:ribosome-associated translation inhibitor RaiA
MRDGSDNNNADVRPGGSMPLEKTMKLTIKHHDLRSTDELDSLVEEQLLRITPRICVEEAVVALGCYRDRSPPYRAMIRIVTPGPDLEVEASDHTPVAAFRQAMNDLDQQLDRRGRNRARQGRSQRQQPRRLRPPFASRPSR